MFGLGIYLLLRCAYIFDRHGSFLFSFFYNFYFSLEDNLQCCDGLCHTSAWISCKYTYVPSLLIPSTSAPIPTLQVITKHQAKLPALYKNFPLSILRMVMYIFQCYSLNATLSFPHCVHKSLLCVCISISALLIGSSVLTALQWKE